jgi:hypothetical protein
MKKKIVAGLVVLGLLVVAATANAFHVHVVAGNLVLDAEGGFAPNALPKHENAPITVHGGGSLSTLSGDLPPILDTFVLEFDKHGALDTTGLATCTKGKLVATDVATARKACSDAIVGTGFGSAVVKFPEQKPIKVGSPITLFNGPKKGRDDTIIAHAHLDYPGPTTFIVPVVIEKIHNLRLVQSRQEMDLQGQEAQLHQRPLRNRSLPGSRRIQLQRRTRRSAGSGGRGQRHHEGQLPAPVQGT